MEGIFLNQTDRKRIKVLHQVELRRMRQHEAAEELGLSPRWVRKLLARLRAEGDGGIPHRLCSRGSNRKLGGDFLICAKEDLSTLR